MLPPSFVSKYGGAKSSLKEIQIDTVTDDDDDHNIIMSGITATTTSTTSSSNSSTNNNQVNDRGNSPPQQQQQHAAELFPYLLHGMLEDLEKVGHASIVSWTVDGKSFRIHDTEQFVSSFLGRYFSGFITLIQFRSQLTDWGFDSPNPMDNETFFHPCFQKSDPSLCHYMRCGKVNNNNKAEDNNNNSNNRKEESISTSKTGNTHTAQVPVVNTNNVSNCISCQRVFPSSYCHREQIKSSHDSILFSFFLMTNRPRYCILDL
jgi:Pyruvate/2-oxoacid:ferredoxin oxidoreductase delta subunit